MRSRPVRTAVILLAAVLLILGFLGRQQVSNFFLPVRQTSLSPLAVGTNVWPGYEPLFLARDLDLFSSSDVRLVEYTSSTQVLRAFRNGVIDVAALTLDEVLSLLPQGDELRIILVTDISDGADAILAQPGIATVAELKGRRVGVESTALGAYMLSRALQLANLTVKDVIVVSHEVDEHEQIFLSGSVDAVVTFEPVRSRLLAAGARQIFDSSQIPGEIIDVLAVRPNALKTRAGQIEALLTGWFKALAFLEAKPLEAAGQMADRLQMEPATILKTYQGMHLPDLAENLAMLSGQTATCRHSARRLANAMLQAGLLSGKVDVNTLPAAGPLEKVAQHHRHADRAQ